jgi:hypothetical protein
MATKAMDAPKTFASPGTPLFPLSPERVNGTRPLYGGSQPQSPAALAMSIPEFGKPSQLGGSQTIDPFQVSSRSPASAARQHRLGHSRNNSDACVQSMVKRFETLTVKDHEAALRRSEMARENAEIESRKLRDSVVEQDNNIKKLREETRRLKAELDEARERERIVVKRNDKLMVSFPTSRESIFFC